MTRRGGGGEGCAAAPSYPVQRAGYTRPAQQSHASPASPLTSIHRFIMHLQTFKIEDAMGIAAPVNFHVVVGANGAGNLTRAVIDRQIAQLNTARHHATPLPVTALPAAVNTALHSCLATLSLHCSDAVSRPVCAAGVVGPCHP